MALSQCSTRSRRRRTGWSCAGEVARGEDIRVRRAQPSVDQDAVADRETGLPGQAHLGLRPDPHHNQVSRERCAVGEPDHARAVGPCIDAVDPDAQPQVDTVLAVEIGEDPRHLGSEHTEQRLVLHLDHGDLDPCGPGGCGHLETDPAPADDHDPADGGEGVAQSPVVLDRAQVGDVGAALVGHRQAARGGTGRQQEPVEASRVAVRDHLVTVEVETGDRRPEVQLNVTIVVPGAVVDLHRLLLRGAEEDALGQRRSLVGQVRLGAEDLDASLVPVAPQLVDR